MSPASEAVFQTTELLEQILSSTIIDLNTLLLSQRVSQKWRAVINKSEIIQQRLFFKPIPTLQEAHDLNLISYFDGKKYVLENARNLEHFDHGEGGNLNIFGWGSPDEMRMGHIFRGVSNPFLFRRDGKMHATVGIPSWLEKWDDPQASWKRMLLTQPPTLNARAKCILEELPEPWRHGLWSPEGDNTVGDMMRRAKGKMGRSLDWTDEKNDILTEGDLCPRESLAEWWSKHEEEVVRSRL